MEWVLDIRADWLTVIMKFFTFLGDEEFFLLFLPIAYWLWRKDIMGRTGMILLFTFVLNALIKGIFQIPRPEVLAHLVEADGWSFTSGHSQGAMVLWGWLAWELKDKRGYLLAGLIILGVGFSRVYLGVHTPLDVFGGFSLGFLSLIVYAYLLELELGGWRPLGPSRQSLIIFVVLMGLFMLAPEVSEVALKGGAAFIGFLAGVLHERRYLAAEYGNSLGAYFGKLLLGFVGILLVWIGLKQIFMSIGFVSEMALFIRYAILGGWIGFGAPYLFVHFGWDHEGAHR
jgi:membrane-associated phospholipid phosphatase